MSPRERRKTTSSLRALDAEQRAEVLKRLVKRRPELRAEVERMAEQVLGRIDVEKVAREVAVAVVTCDADPGGLDELGGYHEPRELTGDALDEAIEPFQRDMKKRLRLGRIEEARRICMGIVLGLYRASQESRANMGALDEMPEWPGEAAEEAIKVYRGRKSRARRPEPPPFPASFWLKMHGGWSDTLSW